MGLVTRSANDAAVLLAETLGGSEENFAAMMTLKARQLGMSSTVYRNASGLPNPEQVTTARDMARLANALLRDFPHYYPVFSVLSYNYKGRPLANHNRMLASYAGADGMKTGYTNASGFNLVMSAVRDNRRLIGVVMGGNTAFQRDRLMADLMDQGFATAEAQAISPWTSPRTPPSARYSAANFVAGLDPVGLSGFTKSEPARALVPASVAGSCRLIRQFAGRSGSRRAGERIASGLDPLARRGDGRRGAGVRQDPAPRAAHQPLAGGSGRRLQEAEPAQNLLLGDAGHRLDHNALSAGLMRARNARL
jgi:hypothetical protein